MRIIPNSMGSNPLREFNSCHNPAGAGGGQFCSKTGGAGGSWTAHDPARPARARRNRRLQVPETSRPYSTGQTTVSMLRGTSDSLPDSTAQALFGKSAQQMAEAMVAGTGMRWEMENRGQGGPPVPIPSDAREQYEKAIAPARELQKQTFITNYRREWEDRRRGLAENANQMQAAIKNSAATVLRELETTSAGPDTTSQYQTLLDEYYHSPGNTVRALGRPATAPAPPQPRGARQMSLPGLAKLRRREGPSQSKLPIEGGLPNRPTRAHIPRTADEAMQQLTELIFKARALRQVQAGGFIENSSTLTSDDKDVIKAWAKYVRPTGAVRQALTDATRPSGLGAGQGGLDSPWAKRLQGASYLYSGEEGLNRWLVRRGYAQEGQTAEQAAEAFAQRQTPSFSDWTAARWPQSVGRTAIAVIRLRNADQTVTIDRRFEKTGTGIKVSHIKFSVADTTPVGLGKQVIRNSFREYQRMGVARVDVNANITTGAYAWARYGFAPNSIATYRNIRSRIGQELRYLNFDANGRSDPLTYTDKITLPDGTAQRVTVRGTLNTKQRAAILKLAQHMVSAGATPAERRAKFWAIIDSKVKGERKVRNADGTESWVPHTFSIGKHLFARSYRGWKGVFRFGNRDQMKRLVKYVGA